MINKNFSDYNFKSTKLLSAWIDRDSDDNGCYLYLTYECIDKNGNEYMVMIPKICLPFINTNEFPWICENRNYDSEISDDMYIQLADDKLEILTASETVYDYNGHAVEYTDEKIIVIPKKNDVPKKMTLSEIEEELGYKIELVEEKHFCETEDKSMITRQEVIERLKNIADTRFTFKPIESKSLITDIDVESLYPTFVLDFSVPTNVVDVVYRKILNYITNDIYTTKEAIKTMRNSIKKIIFNDPATIIIWGNGDKTIVKCGEGETYDPEKGMAMAIAKHFLGDKGNYYETFKKWLPKEHETVKESKSNTERFISIRDFCNRYNITKSKAYRMIKAGDIYAIKNEKGYWMIDTTAGVIKYM